jgi:3-methylcrotonyl-CoA carboxylase alpha subunit
VDLVEWQLRVAAGEQLWVAQEDLAITGHAFEARLYAEDVAAGFLPATGTLSHLRFPEGARAETGVRPGDAISPWYDPMIAKLVVHGPTRSAALGALDRALAETEVAGTVTNLAFLRRLARHEGFGRGEVDTGLIDREGDALTADPVAPPEVRALAAVLSLGLDAPPGHEGFHLWAPLRRAVRMTHRGDAVEGTVAALGGGRYAVDLGGGAVEVSRTAHGFTVGGRPVRATWHRGPDRLTVFHGDAFPFLLPDPLDVARAAGAGSGVVEAPMPGLVKALFVAAGDTVAAGDRLAVLEAMKMEHTLRASRDGTVAEVPVREGAQVEAGAALVVMEGDPDDAAG